LNVEGDRLVKAIPGSRQVRGSDSDEEKEAAFSAFASGALRVLVSKPKIGAWGLNFQNCAHVVTFASHSYEQFYQSIRRCYRFGQERPVVVDIIATKGEAHVIANMLRKAEQADEMFAELVSHMNDSEALRVARNDGQRVESPTWA
jgi:SNF2 family DNA or RNA helicase